MTSLDRGANRLLAGAGDPAPPRRWRAFSLLAAGYFMTAVDLTIVNVALAAVPVAFLLIRPAVLARAATR